MKRNYFNCEPRWKGGLILGVALFFIIGGIIEGILGIILGITLDSNYFYLLFGLMGVLLCGLGVRGLLSEKSYERYLAKKENKNKK